MLSKNLWPVIIGGVSLSLAGTSYYLNQNRHLFETKLNSWEYTPDVSVQYILKGKEPNNENSICERWTKNKQGLYELDQLDKSYCQTIISKNLWGQDQDGKEYTEWLKVNNEFADDIAWQYYLTKGQGDTREKLSDNDWETRGLTCKKINKKEKVVITCQKKLINQVSS